MIEKERIEEAKRNVKQYLDEGLLRIKDKDTEGGCECDGGCGDDRHSECKDEDQDHHDNENQDGNDEDDN
jgi:hypothetical protein